ncbi:hypothetical protein JL107_08650 [Nakamurella flavida]|uniref:Uncharacterized protein n=1 Tax=Nakamurella flavida TaxID=363630 RepID=A0A938YKS5_9ACTN|nr:hypothetical protein [Nakamurella flavida]MBM9476508.1 hypothetical protein [Nakamurella flavida]MDP9779054.1 hypothetical protein [Nakamurella flavida]
MDDQGAAERTLGRYRASGTMLVISTFLWGLLLVTGLVDVQRDGTFAWGWVFIVVSSIALVGTVLVPATVIGRHGVRVRVAPLRWRTILWSQVEAVYPPGSGESSVLVKVRGRSSLVSLDGVGRDRLVGVVLLARRSARQAEQVTPRRSPGPREPGPRL